MKKRVRIYVIIGIAWLACSLFQAKNGNMFMVAVSAILAVLFLVCGIYEYYKNNR